MLRADVYLLIDGERKYQLQQHEIVAARFPHRDEDHHVADWITYMEIQLAQAKNGVYDFDMSRALSHVRKATALGVACMEHNETPPRKKEVANDLKQ